MEYAGYVEPGGYDQVVFRGDPSIVDGKAPEFVAMTDMERKVSIAVCHTAMNSRYAAITEPASAPP